MYPSVKQLIKYRLKRIEEDINFTKDQLASIESRHLETREHFKKLNREKDELLASLEETK